MGRTVKTTFKQKRAGDSSILVSICFAEYHPGTIKSNWIRKYWIEWDRQVKRQPI